MSILEMRDQFDNYFVIQLKREPLNAVTGQGPNLPPQIGDEFFIVVTIKNTSNESSYKETGGFWRPWYTKSDEELAFISKMKIPDKIHYKDIKVDVEGTIYAEIVDGIDNKLAYQINKLAPGENWVQWIKMKAIKAVEGINFEPNINVKLSYAIDFDATFTFSIKTGLTEDIKPNFG